MSELELLTLAAELDAAETAQTFPTIEDQDAREAEQLATVASWLH